MATKLIDIGIENILPDPTQPRKTFVKEAIERLAASISARGMLQPIRVARDESRQVWLIVTGESRWRAAHLVPGMTHVPCLVVEGQPEETDLLMDRIVENAVRNDLRPLEEARALVRLKNLKRCTSQQLAAELGMANSSVCRLESLLRLPEDVQELIDDELLSESAGYELTKLPDHESMRALANQVVTCRLSRDQTIELVRLQVPKKNVQPKAGRVAGKVEGVAFTFAFQSGELDAVTLLRAIEQIRSKLRAFKGEPKDGAALADLLKAAS